MTLVGIGINNWGQNVPKVFVKVCEELDVKYRLLDLNNVSMESLVGVTHIAPALLIFQPRAVRIYEAAESSGTKYLNSVAAIAIADDKTLTCKRLWEYKVPQIETKIIPLTLNDMKLVFEEEKREVVFKMPHGGQGRWVRKAQNDIEVESIFHEFSAERIVPIVAQPFIAEAKGESLRLIILNGRMIASSQRKGRNDWRSNISIGGEQVRYSPSEEEAKIAIEAARALGLGFAGVDLIHTNLGTKVIEVNACPDFTSMASIGYSRIAREVIEELIISNDPQGSAVP